MKIKLRRKRSILSTFKKELLKLYNDNPSMTVLETVENLYGFRVGGTIEGLTPPANVPSKLFDDFVLGKVIELEQGTEN